MLCCPIGPAVYGGCQFLPGFYRWRVPRPPGGGHGQAVAAHVLPAEPNAKSERDHLEFCPVGKIRRWPTDADTRRWRGYLPRTTIPLPARPLKDRRRMTMKPTIGLLACSIALAGCSNMNQTQQRALSGTAIGAGGGAILGAIGGNAA